MFVSCGKGKANIRSHGLEGVDLAGGDEWES